ncbi:TonB-dependent receptor domain-containing protein (plasmid) [Brevundimonas staleyi]|uniref:TonB-dependent receptor domain-containing protein n=1 Tax=Brevundimonas staleyi TaxID=74326 RepID=A0ABW0FN41_9CAUL
MRINDTFGFRTWAMAGVAAMAISSPACAQEADRPFNIPTQDLSAALEAFGQQGDAEILFDRRQTAGKRSAAVVGAYTRDVALQRLVGGSGLVVRRVNASTFVVEPSRPQVDATDASQLEEVVVTGSRIRGAPPASPVIRLSQDDMRNAGNNNLGDAIRQLPQNFSGGKNPAIGLGAGDANSNPNSSSQLNLRGLGPDATLTLLNGRRLAYSGVTQGVDITAVPLDAVDRLEILADGASALYGSDAVGGVANVILKRNYDGVSATARFGAATNGGAEQQQYSVVGGRTWDGGSLIATLNYEDSTEITAAQRTYTSGLGRTQIIYPPIEAWGGVVSAHQILTSFATLNIDAIYSDRNTASTTALTTAPYTTSGSASNADNASFTIAPNLDIALPGRWTANAAFVYGRDNTRQAGFSYSGGVATPSQVLKYDNTVELYEVSGEGPLTRLPAGDVRLAVGGGLRQVGLETYRGPRGATPATRLTPSQDARYAYGELYVPLFGGASAPSGFGELALTAAARYEDYDQAGDILVPKVGIIYSPTGDFDLKASWGKSFKTPILNRQYQVEQVVLFDASLFGAGYPVGSTVLYRSGGNPDVGPERAESWSATAALHPRSLPELEVSVSYFDVDYRDRIVSPIASIAGSLSNPLYASFVTLSPSAGLQNDIISNASGGFQNASSVPYNPASVLGILDTRFANAARQHIRGVDVQAAYDFDLGRYGSLSASTAATYLTSDQTLLAGQPSTNLSGIIFNPPKIRGTASLTWRISDLILTPQAIYTGSLSDNRRTPNVRIDDQVAFNLTARYNIETSLPGLKGLALSASVLNITDEDPEPIAATTIYNSPYESTNYTPMGRFVGMSLTARW